MFVVNSVNFCLLRYITRLVISRFSVKWGQNRFNWLDSGRKIFLGGRIRAGMERASDVMRTGKVISF